MCSHSVVKLTITKCIKGKKKSYKNHDKQRQVHTDNKIHAKLKKAKSKLAKKKEKVRKEKINIDPI